MLLQSNRSTIGIEDHICTHPEYRQSGVAQRDSGFVRKVHDGRLAKGGGSGGWPEAKIPSQARGY